MAKATLSTEGYVYFIHAPEVGRIKIGFTQNLAFRLRELEMGSPTHLLLMRSVQGTLHLEQTILSLFHKYRLHGEWFSAAPVLVRFIERLKDGTKYSSEELLTK